MARRDIEVRKDVSGMYIVTTWYGKDFVSLRGSFEGLQQFLAHVPSEEVPTGFTEEYEAAARAAGLTVVMASQPRLPQVE